MQEHHSNPIDRYFAGLTEYTFQTRLGVADPPLIDYVSDLLSRFVRNDAMFRVRDTKGRPLLNVSDMLVEAQQRIGEAKREVHRHIGDFTLFWAGLYPESIQGKQGPGAGDPLIDYCEQGKRAYWVASTIEADHDVQPSCDILGRLSSCFEMCTYGLREVRREWERRDGDGVALPFFFEG